MGFAAHHMARGHVVRNDESGVNGPTWLFIPFWGPEAKPDVSRFCLLLVKKSQICRRSNMPKLDLVRSFLFLLSLEKIREDFNLL
jgi:hypothetical protein